MRFGGLFLVYIVIGVLVAAGVIGSEPNYFSGLNTLEEIVEMLIAVFLWPLVLLGVSIDIGGVESGGGGDGGDGGGGGKGGDAGGNDAGGKGGGK